ncbi:MAG: T9SS type A sorting domain-containing protein, partial [Bacteroidota bacterium]|nr:T9SS type A sorting domain-containing protein [Bacteroidota bacterium]
NASVQGNARIEGHAIVKGTATISGNAVVKGTAMVGSSAKVRENAVVDKSSRVFYSSDIHGQALVTGSAIVYSSAVYGSAVVKDLAWLDGAIVYGTAIIGGDAEDFDSISAGTYLQDYGLRKGDGLTVHPLNVDINPDIDEYVTAIPEHKASDILFQYYTGSDGQLILKSTKPAIVTFFNLSGLQVCRIYVSGTYTLPANQLGSRGIYLMNVRCGNGQQTYKVIE